MKGSQQMELNRAFDAVLAILAKVSRDQLDAPTPCASWDANSAWSPRISPSQRRRARALLDQYIAAFENADADALERLLLADATLEATPLRTWYRGRGICVPFLRGHVLGVPGDWRMLPAGANGQPAAVCFTRDADGAYQPYGVCLLTIRGEGISGVVSFGDPGLVAAFGHGA
jgi:RNA polymerase sigma-70 factor, ECF subfamily